MRFFALISCLSLFFAAPRKRRASEDVHQMGSLQKRSRFHEPKVAVNAEPDGPIQFSAFYELPITSVVEMEIESSQPMDFDAPIHDQGLPEAPIACPSGFNDDPSHRGNQSIVFGYRNAFKCDFYSYRYGQY
jgi:hypothetical protein